MNRYKEGDIILVKVSGIENYGFFVKVDSEYSGLVHISEISDKFVKDINYFVSVGDDIKAKILAIDEGKKQMKLSIKGVRYRMNGVGHPRIKETPKGFDTLGRKLNGWIETKKEELINSKENKEN